MDQIWTFNLVNIYAMCIFCYLTYNVFSFYGLSYILFGHLYGGVGEQEGRNTHTLGRCVAERVTGSAERPGVMVSMIAMTGSGGTASGMDKARWSGCMETPMTGSGSMARGTEQVQYVLYVTYVSSVTLIVCPLLTVTYRSSLTGTQASFMIAKGTCTKGSKSWTRSTGEVCTRGLVGTYTKGSSRMTRCTGAACTRIAMGTAKKASGLRARERARSFALSWMALGLLANTRTIS
jgi:hypothetical protein